MSPVFLRSSLSLVSGSRVHARDGGALRDARMHRPACTYPSVHWDPHPSMHHPAYLVHSRLRHADTHV